MRVIVDTQSSDSSESSPMSVEVGKPIDFAPGKLGDGKADATFKPLRIHPGAVKPRRAKRNGREIITDRTIQSLCLHARR